MKSTSKTEQEMREEKVPCPLTTAELTEYIESLTNREHDYGTCVYAMSMAATAAFFHVAHKLGVTGFQSSMADLDILRRTRLLECPFMIITADKMLYPQYDPVADLTKALQEWRGWATVEAQKHLKKSPDAHPAVIARWKQLADG